MSLLAVQPVDTLQRLPFRDWLVPDGCAVMVLDLVRNFMTTPVETKHGISAIRGREDLTPQ
jgi:hypothetical protein